MKAVIYSRFSTDKQDESSIADQVRVCREYAERHGMQVMGYYEDQGISGAALGNRPGVLKLRDDGFARRFQVLLVVDLNRLARSEDLPPLIQRLRFVGVRVVGIQDGFDSDARTARMQAGMAAIMGAEFIQMVAARTYAALETRAKTKRATGGRAYAYIAAAKSETGAMVVNPGEAPTVVEIFERFANGASCKTIAGELNRSGRPSPGSSWNRTVRRASGWMASGIRAILRNPIYKGEVVWNASEWRKDPDSGKRVRVLRPVSERIAYQNEELRIVSNELWERAQRRTKVGSDVQKSGGKPKYLLSGLLRCESCGAHYVLGNGSLYGCSSNLNGKACGNDTRIGRETVEQKILDPIRYELLSPARIESMGKLMQSYYAQRIRELDARAATLPTEQTELDARIARLKDRLRAGDPDMTADEIQAAIDRAETKRRELEAVRPNSGANRITALLPRAADLYRKQIAKGLAGDERAALKARVVLRNLFGGKIGMKPGPEGSLWAEFQLHPGVLLRDVGTSGSGGRICPVPPIQQRVQLK